MTTTPITRQQIAALRNEAAEHGDLEMVAVCDRALWQAGLTDGEGSQDEAWAECERVIHAAQAQAGGR